MVIITRETKKSSGISLTYDKKGLSLFMLHELINGKIHTIILAPKEIEKLHKEFGKILDLIYDKERMEGEV